MANNYFDESLYDFLPNIGVITSKVQDLDSTLVDVLSNYHSFENELNDVRHGDVVLLRIALSNLSDNIDKLNQLMSLESMSGEV